MTGYINGFGSDIQDKALWILHKNWKANVMEICQALKEPTIEVLKTTRIKNNVKGYWRRYVTVSINSLLDSVPRPVFYKQMTTEIWGSQGGEAVDFIVFGCDAVRTRR
jgi:hypothetical protein